MAATPRFWTESRAGALSHSDRVGYVPNAKRISFGAADRLRCRPPYHVWNIMPLLSEWLAGSISGEFGPVRGDGVPRSQLSGWTIQSWWPRSLENFEQDEHRVGTRLVLSLGRRARVRSTDPVRFNWALERSPWRRKVSAGRWSFSRSI